MFNTSSLKVGDAAYYATRTRGFSYAPPKPAKGTVGRITPSGQIIVHTDRGDTRRFGNRGDEIGGHAFLIDEESYDSRLRHHDEALGRREVRDKLRSLADMKVDDKEAVLQALREAVALAETRLVRSEED